MKELYRQLRVWIAVRKLRREYRRMMKRISHRLNYWDGGA